MKKVMTAMVLMATLSGHAMAAQDVTVFNPENSDRQTVERDNFKVVESEELTAEEALEDVTVCRRQTVCSSFGGCFQRVTCVPTYRYSDQYEYYPW